MSSRRKPLGLQERRSGLGRHADAPLSGEGTLSRADAGTSASWRPRRRAHLQRCRVGARETRPWRPLAIRVAARSGLPGWASAQPAGPLKRQRRGCSAARHRSWLCASPDVDWRSRGVRSPRGAADRLAIAVQSSDTEPGNASIDRPGCRGDPGIPSSNETCSRLATRAGSAMASVTDLISIVDADSISPTSSMRPSSEGGGPGLEAGEKGQDARGRSVCGREGRRRELGFGFFDAGFGRSVACCGDFAAALVRCGDFAAALVRGSDFAVDLVRFFAEPRCCSAF
jgi:hypothetical protein